MTSKADISNEYYFMISVTIYIYMEFLFTPMTNIYFVRQLIGKYKKKQFLKN